MREFNRCLVLAMSLLLSNVAYAGIKHVEICDGVSPPEWREYLVGGSPGQPGNELWARGYSKCLFELWDLTLIDVQSVSGLPSPDTRTVVGAYLTNYDDGFLRTDQAPYNGVVWDVWASVTALYLNDGRVRSTVDLWGTNPTNELRLEAQLVTEFANVVAGNGCLPWADPTSCTSYDYLGNQDGQGNPANVQFVSGYLRVVPEPGMLSLLGIGLLGYLLARRR